MSGSEDGAGAAIHVPYLQEAARPDLEAAERATLRRELKGFLRVCDQAKSGPVCCSSHGRNK